MGARGASFGPRRGVLCHITAASALSEQPREGPSAAGTVCYKSVWCWPLCVYTARECEGSSTSPLAAGSMASLHLRSEDQQAQDLYLQAGTKYYLPMARRNVPTSGRKGVLSPYDVTSLSLE